MPLNNDYKIAIFLFTNNSNIYWNNNDHNFFAQKIVYKSIRYVGIL